MKHLSPSGKTVVLDRSEYMKMIFAVQNTRLNFSDINTGFNIANSSVITTLTAGISGEWGVITGSQMSLGDVVYKSTIENDFGSGVQYTFNNQGALTDKSWTSDGLVVEVFNDTAIPDLSLFLAPSRHTKGLSFADKGQVKTALYKIQLGVHIACLTGDQGIRKFSKNLGGFPVYGFVSFLASLALHEVISTQLATAIYEKMKKHDPRWVPKNMSFSDCKIIEQVRMEFKQSFWCSSSCPHQKQRYCGC